MEVYDWHFKQTWKRLSMIETAKEDGMKEGIVKGEKNKQIEIAKNLLNANMDMEFISQTTGLTVAEIKSIR